MPVDNLRREILRTIAVALSFASGAAAGFFILRFLGIPFWEHIIAPAFNFVANDLLGALIIGSDLLGGILFALSYLVFGVYFLFFLLAGSYLAAKLYLRIITH